LIVITLIPFLAALTLVAVGVAPFVGPFALVIVLVALGLWGLWKAVVDFLDLRDENVLRLAETTELLGRGGPDDPDFVLVRRRPQGAKEEAPTDAAAAARISSIERTGRRGGAGSSPA
jgi:hypothetical protein